MRSEIQKIGTDGLPPGGLLGLAVLFGAGLLLWVANQSARVYQHVVPRFARAQPLVGQYGVAGRAAVLSARDTHRGLILLEQKSAFEEELSGLLGLDRPSTMHALVATLRERGVLPEPVLAELVVVEKSMAKIELAVTAGRSLRVSRDQVEHAERVRQLVVAALVAPVVPPETDRPPAAPAG